MGALSGSHIFLLLVVAVVLFGGSRLADVGKGLGEGIKNFKKGLNDHDDDGPKLKGNDTEREVLVRQVKAGEGESDGRKQLKSGGSERE